MKEIEIKNYKTKADFKNVIGKTKEYELYHSSLFNYINGTMASSQTGPRKVGQLTELFKEFRSIVPENEQSVTTWKEYYLKSEVLSGKTGQEALVNAVNKNLELKNKVLKILNKPNINEEITGYLEDLIFNKTFNGLAIEPYAAYAGIKDFILNERKEKFIKDDVRGSTPEEESRNIDAVYQEKINIQVKPMSYQARNDGVQFTNLNNMLVVYYEVVEKDVKLKYEFKE